MFTKEDRLTRKNEKLIKENKELNEKIKVLEEQLSETNMYFNQRVALMDKKEKEYSNMLIYLDKLRTEYEILIQKTKDLQNEIQDKLKNFK